MSIKFAKRVTFLCPAMTTGGPEAIHQASQVLNEQGVRSDILYTGNGAQLTVANGRISYTPPSVNPCLEAYRDYRPVVCGGALLRRHHLFVLPEVYAGDFTILRGASVAVWWLSVDNALETLADTTFRAVLSSPTLRHFHQSVYAEDFLRRSGVPRSAPLFDYTTPEFTSLVPEGPNPDPAVAYNPAKGAQLSESFFARHPEHLGVPIRGMTKSEIADRLRATMVYVDFGHLPGKDRLPREAAASGAVVFVRNRGAGRLYGDFPVPDFFRFEDDDVHSGELARRIAAVREDPAGHWGQQESLRRQVLGEQAELHAQVAALRGQHRAA